MNIAEVSEPKKYENYHAKPVSDPFKSIAERRKVRALPRKMNIEEVEEPETTKIHMQNTSMPTRAKPKLRKFTYKTNMEARNHENSDEFRPPPLRHLDLPPRPFTSTVRTPSVNHTVWGNMYIYIFLCSYALKVVVFFENIFPALRKYALVF